MKYINNKNYQRLTTLSLTLFALVSCSSMSNRVYYSEEEKDKIEDIIERGSNTSNSSNNEIKHLVYEDDFYLLEKVNKYDKLFIAS